jgi:hypothetical protein
MHNIQTVARPGPLLRLEDRAWALCMALPHGILTVHLCVLPERRVHLLATTLRMHAGWSATRRPTTCWVWQAMRYLVLLVAVRLDDIKQRCAAMAIRNSNCNSQERARHRAGWLTVRCDRSTTGHDTV